MEIVEMRGILPKRSVRARIVREIREGSVFLYPTDTQYGIGCNATMSKSVRRIRMIKYTGHPFSVIAPSIEWIYKNMVVVRPDYIEKFPGPYTFIMKMKNRPVCREVSEKKTLGVRIPNHPFTRLVQEAGVPFVTTSANMSGETPLWNTIGVPAGISKHVDIAIHDDILNNPASTIIDITTKKPRVLRRPVKMWTHIDAFEEKK